MLLWLSCSGLCRLRAPFHFFTYLFQPQGGLRRQFMCHNWEKWVSEWVPSSGSHITLRVNEFYHEKAILHCALCAHICVFTEHIPYTLEYGIASSKQFHVKNKGEQFLDESVCTDTANLGYSFQFTLATSKGRKTIEFTEKCWRGRFGRHHVVAESSVSWLYWARRSSR